MTHAGDSIFDEIFLEYYPLLSHFGWKIHPDKSLIEECIQDLFLHLYERNTDFSKIKNTKAYLFTSYRREYLKLLAKRRNLSTSEIDTDIAYTEDDFSQGHTSHISKSEHIVEALNQLPWRQREAVYLKYFNQLSIKEIAEIMGIQPQVVSNTLYKALSKLRNHTTLIYLGTTGTLFSLSVG